MAVQIKIHGNNFLIISIFATNSQSKRRKLWIWIKEKSLGREMILCGDFNRGDEKGLEEWDVVKIDGTLADACELTREGDNEYAWSKVFVGGRKETNRLENVYITH